MYYEFFFGFLSSSQWNTLQGISQAVEIRHLLGSHRFNHKSNKQIFANSGNTITLI